MVTNLKIKNQKTKNKMGYKMKGFSGFGNSPAKQLKNPPLSENEKKMLKRPKKHDAHVKTTESEMFLRGKTVSGKDIKWVPGPKKEHPYLFDPSPAKQEGPIDEKQIKLQKSENPDTWVYDPKKDTTKDKKFVKNERIIDLEDRISFIREDIWNKQTGPADAPTDESQGTEQQKKDLAKLRQEMAILKKSKH